jgi:Fic family protein
LKKSLFLRVFYVLTKSTNNQLLIYRKQRGLTKDREMWEIDIPDNAKPVGYRWLVEQYGIEVFDHYRWSYVSEKWEKKELHFDDQNLTLHIFPPSTQVKDDPFDHLEFALKHEGVNLSIIKAVCFKLPETEVTDYVSNRLTGKYSRVIWFLYEAFHSKQLPIADVKKGSYVPILDEENYYCGKATRSKRHRVTNNLPGSINFCPLVRKTAVLKAFESKKLQEVIHDVAEKYDDSVIFRAMRYLYTKETMSSWEIEREKPDKARLDRFVELLHRADSISPLSKESLVELQYSIVDKRFTHADYRDFQNYVGEEPGLGQMTVHYIAPKPEDVAELMEGMIQSFRSMREGDVPPVVAAAVLAFSFVFIHPFEDGNGRIHRFLVHYALARMGFSPRGLVFPVSSVIVRAPQNYDRVLEIFSKPLMRFIKDYDVNDIGELVVNQKTADYYRYIDFTAFAEYLFDCVEQTIETDFKHELSFLIEYDAIKLRCKEIVDMPDQRLDLFIRCVRQNGGELSARKRERYFSMLTESEIKEMEEVIENTSTCS